MISTKATIKNCLEYAGTAAYFSLRMAKVLFFGMVLLFCTSQHSGVLAQEINFGELSSKYGVTVTELNPAEDLEFGMVLQNEGLKTVELQNAKVLMIEGVKYLDVIVEIVAENYLYLDGNTGCADTSCRMDFTLQAAYANRGNNNTNQAVLMQVASSIASAQFPILARGNRPPGPPPTPDYEGYNPAVFNETAYLYIYGSLSVGNVDAGSYSGNITVTVTYD